MLYEPRKKRPKRRRHPIRHGILRTALALLALLLLLSALAVGILYAVPVSLFMLDPGEELSINPNLPVTRANILLLGVDSLNDGQQRSDSMMVLSIGADGVTLVSLMRDMLVQIPGMEGAQKLNAAYAHGGAELAMRTVNHAFAMNVTKYVQVDYEGFARVVDALGGVRVQITEAERDRINAIVRSREEQLRQHGYLVTPLEGFGEDTQLNGFQALTYARIRKLDSDYNRTGRQRQLIEAIWKQVRAKGVPLAAIGGLAQALRQDVDTNMNWAEAIGLGMKLLRAGGIDMHRLPAEGYYSDDGSALTIDAAGNAAQLRQWLYGE